MALSELERSVTDAIARRGDELVALAASLIALDTTARNVGDPPRDEAALQNITIASRDAREAMQAFFQKRPPVFEGR